MERSGDACDSYHRYREDMRLLADAGLNAYRFGIEWARVEPVPGMVSRAELAHYRRMIDTAFELGLTPVVTLHHFTSPLWFTQEGGWLGERAIDRFRTYAETVAPILDGVEWVVTMNEPNMLAIMAGMARAMQSAQADGEWQSPTLDTDGPRPPLPAPDAAIGARLVEAHHAAREVLRERTGAKVGWTVANRAFVARPGRRRRSGNWSTPGRTSTWRDPAATTSSVCSRTPASGSARTASSPTRRTRTTRSWAPPTGPTP